MFCPCNPYPYEDVFEEDNYERAKACWKCLGYVAVNDLVLVLLCCIVYTPPFLGKLNTVHWVFFGIAILTIVGVACAFLFVPVLRTSEMFGLQLLLALVVDVAAAIIFSVLVMVLSAEGVFYGTVSLAFLIIMFVITVIEVLVAMCNTIGMTLDWGFVICACLWIVAIISNLVYAYFAFEEDCVAEDVPVWMYVVLVALGLLLMMVSISRLCAIHYIMARESWWWTDYGMEKACMILAIRTTVMVWPVNVF